MAPFEVKLSPDLVKEVYDVLDALEIKPNPIKKDATEPISLVSDHVLEEFVATKPQPAGVVSWSPPQPNWNPWMGCNIDEGPLAHASMDQISEDLSVALKDKMQNDQHLQKMIESRSKLPIHGYKTRLMDAINDNPVVIIQGNTGCGKTTQESEPNSNLPADKSPERDKTTNLLEAVHGLSIEEIIKNEITHKEESWEKNYLTKNPSIKYKKVLTAGGSLSDMTNCKDDSAIFAAHVASELRKLSPVSQATVKHMISNILFEAAMGKYDPIDSLFLAASKVEPTSITEPQSDSKFFPQKW